MRNGIFPYNQVSNYIFILIAMVSCSKEENVVAINTTPLIKLNAVSATRVLQFKDSLVVVIDYKDGDGDIGETDPDRKSIEVKDNRLSKADYYFIKPLSPPGSSIKTEGSISINLKSPFLLGTADEEITTFEIRIKDREGNWSNSVKTPEIVIYR
ncbi:MAG: hypothetical protein H6605_07850 [Flavobacteriales bacterium]|nr:hypothetical protein [Flavobacteriales bacterium]